MFQYRNPELYGGVSLEDINIAMQIEADRLGLALDCYHSNHAGDIVDRIHQAFFDETDAIIINPGAFTNCDCGIKEALSLIKAPVIEIHMANLFKKKEGIPQGTTTQVATAVIMGLQLDSYLLALNASSMLIEKQNK